MDPISEVVAVARAGRAVAVRNRYAGAWSTRFPAVNGSGLHIVTAGSPWVLPETGEPLRLSPGDIAFVPHGQPHALSHVPMRFQDVATDTVRTPDRDSYDVEFVSCCYHLDRGQVHDSLTGLPDVIAVTVVDDDPTIRTLAELLGEHAVDDRHGSDIALSAIVDLLLVHLLRAWRNRPGSEDLPNDPEIARVLHRVRSDPGTVWTVEQLSRLAGLSRSAFSRRFADAVGETPGTYLVRRRLDRGAHMLRHTRQPLAAIAAQLGYSNEFSFSSAFRRQFAIAPGRFRQREDVPRTSDRHRSP